MKSISTITATIFIVILSGCTESSDNSLISSQKKEIQTPYELTGEWQLYETRIVDSVDFITSYFVYDAILPAYESGPFENIEQFDFKFTKDSVFIFNYPMEMYSKQKYSQDTNYLNFGNNSVPVKLKNDTLNLYLDSREGIYLKETYVRTTFDSDTLEILKKDKINYALLNGKWYLQRDYTYDYGTNYWLEYDYELKDSINISFDDIKTTEENRRSIMVNTSGKLKEYFVEYNKPYLVLRPGAWFTGDDPYIHYARFCCAWED